MAIPLTLSALLIEVIVGYPDWLVGAIGHPVTWFGALIARLDGALNRGSGSDTARRLAGGLALLLLLLVAAGTGFALERGLLMLPYGFAAVAVIASTLIAQRSLHRHVADVATALETHGLAAGRRAVAHIVGRDPDALDEAG
jgi:adenosylcobinamide-phosphate synthase